MPLRLAIFFGIVAALWTAGSIAYARPPTGGWVVSFDDAQCLAFRDYGTKEAPIQLILKTPPIGGVVQLAIARKGSHDLASQVKGTLAIDEGPPSKISMLAYSPKGTELRVYSMNLPESDFALIRQAKTLTIQGGGLEESLALSDMAPMLKVVDDCVADLRRVFNITDTQAGETSTLKRRVKANLGRLFSGKDYPRHAIERGQEGRVKFGLLVNEQGRVADCTIIETSGVAVLDAQSCAILKERARFQPALGADGKPAKDAVTAAINWSVAW